MSAHQRVLPFPNDGSDDDEKEEDANDADDDEYGGNVTDDDCRAAVGGSNAVAGTPVGGVGGGRGRASHFPIWTRSTE